MEHGLKISSIYRESIGGVGVLCILWKKNYTLFVQTTLEVRLKIAIWCYHQITEMSSRSIWHLVEILIYWSKYVKNSNIFNFNLFIFEFRRKDSFSWVFPPHLKITVLSEITTGEDSGLLPPYPPALPAAARCYSPVHSHSLLSCQLGYLGVFWKIPHGTVIMYSEFLDKLPGSN